MVVGVSTAVSDAIAEEMTRDVGGPGFKVFAAEDRAPVPMTNGASPSAQVMHGIPTPMTLVEGDLISIDVSFHFSGDDADYVFSAVVGNPEPKVQRLLDVTDKSL